ncbi:IclR family transcriptional regulator [Streptomyces sp. 846.5]|nr:IclR family transcriptional regulator [Streptomyces sp. 846.5]TDU02422.1 IclR family transcriptional regulator [Streptomyces sp. 846.5]
MSSGQPEPGSRSAADRLLDVLGAFDQDNQALSLTAIARRAELQLTTAHRLVGALTRWGALERDDAGVYRIGLRLWETAALAPRGVVLRQTAMPYLEDLYEATHENVHLAVRDGFDVVYIERISGRSAVGVRSQVGARWPLHATGVGLALLAHADVDLQEQVMDRPLASFTPYTVTDPARLRRLLAEARRTGYAVSDRQITDDAVSVAAPVFGAGGEPAAAVSVVVHAEDAQPRQLGPAVLVAARGISRALGWQPR